MADRQWVQVRLTKQQVTYWNGSRTGTENKIPNKGALMLETFSRLRDRKKIETVRIRPKKICHSPNWRNRKRSHRSISTANRSRVAADIDLLRQADEQRRIPPTGTGWAELPSEHRTTFWLVNITDDEKMSLWLVHPIRPFVTIRFFLLSF